MTKCDRPVEELVALNKLGFEYNELFGDPNYRRWLKPSEFYTGRVALRIYLGYKNHWTYKNMEFSTAEAAAVYALLDCG